GTYRRFARLKCHANTVGWDRLNEAVNSLLETVKGRIDRLVADPLTALRQETWAKECELTTLLWSLDVELRKAPPDQRAALAKPPNPDRPLLEIVFEQYNAMHAAN